MPRTRSQRLRERAWLAMLLAWVGGFTDAVGYLTLYHLFTSHQSGNSVVLGVSIGVGHWDEVLRRSFPIVFFILGLALGTVLAHRFARAGVRSAFAGVLGVEAGLLLLFVVLGSLARAEDVLQPNTGSVYYPLAALPALAMGLQNTTLRRIADMGIRTTFVSGVLSGVVEEFVAHCFWLHDARQRGHRLGLLLCVSMRRPALVRALLLAAIWSSFLLGAALGAFGQLYMGLVCLLLPVGVLGVIAVLDAVRPILPPHKRMA